MEVEERDPIHPLLHPNATFRITPNMLCMDEIGGWTPLKDLCQIQLVLTRIPVEALHKLQVSMNHEVQSQARKDLNELKKVRKKLDVLEIVYDQAKSKTREERERIKGLE